MQLVMVFVTLIVLAHTHLWTVAFGFLVVMQIGAVLGAIWAARLKRMFQSSRRHAARLDRG